MQPFSMGMDGPQLTLTEVFTMFYICTYRVFTLWDISYNKCTHTTPSDSGTGIYYPNS